MPGSLLLAGITVLHPKINKIVKYRPTGLSLDGETNVSLGSSLIQISCGGTRD